ncbi:MAG TPA: HRDC domain-containing protein [Acidimicrobiales bacterium]|jgi:ribonuclease D
MARSSAKPEFRWVDDADGLDAVVQGLAGTGAYALDTEFHRERTYYAQLALLQLAWDDQIALVDPLAVDIRPLHDMLVRPVPCLMHAAAQDLAILERACGALPAQLADTQIAAGFVGLGTPGLGVLLQRRLGVHLPKADRLTDWLRRPVDPAAASYAAADVAHLHALWHSLITELEARGRLAWVLDECEHQRCRYGELVEIDQAWWRIKEARRLKGRSRCVAQEVAGWRELRAQRLDKPVRHILPDLAVVAIAERPPRTRTDLQRVRGLDGRHLRGGASAELMDAIEAGQALDEDKLQIPDREGVDPTLRPAVTLASAWVSQIARDLDLDASLLATRADIEGLVRGDATSRLLSGWRGEVAGEPVRQLLSGRAALAFNGEGSLVLERRSRQPMADGDGS